MLTIFSSILHKIVMVLNFGGISLVIMINSPGFFSRTVCTVCPWLFIFMFRVMVFNATFSNISVISWWSVLLVEETGEPAENHRPTASHLQTLLHNVVSSTPSHERDSNSQR